jgi:hypothetical protein
MSRSTSKFWGQWFDSFSFSDDKDVQPYHRQYWKSEKKGLYALSRYVTHEIIFQFWRLASYLRRRWNQIIHASFSSGARSAFIALLVVTVGTVLALTSVLYLINKQDGNSVGFLDAMTGIWQKVLDPGSIESIGGDGVYVAIMVTAIIAGLALMSALIGVVDNAISEKIDWVKNANPPIRGRGHRLLIGWSEFAMRAVLFTDPSL